MSQITNLLTRAVTLATESSNGTMNTLQIGAANAEFLNILGEIANINTNTEYNGIKSFNTASRSSPRMATRQTDNAAALAALTVSSALMESRRPAPFLSRGSRAGTPSSLSPDRYLQRKMRSEIANGTTSHAISIPTGATN